MTREEIIREIRQLDREQLEQLRLFLDRLRDRKETRPPDPAPDLKDPECGK